MRVADLLAVLDPAPEATNPGDRDVITGVGGRLVHESHGLSVQSHELTLKTDVADFGDFLLTITPVVLKEKSNRSGGVPVGAVQRDLKDISSSLGLGDLESLDRRQLRGKRKVEIVTVLEELDGLGGRRGGRSVDQESMELGLTGETMVNCVSLIFVLRLLIFLQVCAIDGGVWWGSKFMWTE